MVTSVQFDFSKGRANELIKRQRFFVEQVQDRFLSQLSEPAITAEANEFEERSWARSGECFDPEFDDESLQAEMAIEEGVAHWELLHDLRKNLILSAITTLYHDWEKQLRYWLTGEVHRWSRSGRLKSAVWDSSFDEALNLLKHMGYDVRSKPFFTDLDACRLVVNVNKHGNGTSFKALAKRYPRYVRGYVASPDTRNCELDAFDWRGVIDLELTRVDLDLFSEVIIEFWNGFPEKDLEVVVESAPKWFRVAFRN